MTWTRPQIGEVSNAGWTNRGQSGCGIVLCRCLSGYGVYPTRRTVSIVLLLPDRHAEFQLVDNVTAGIECRVAMRRGHAYPHCALPDLETAYPMPSERREHIESSGNFNENPLALRARDRRMRFVLQCDHGLAVIVIPNPAFERDTGPGSITG